MATAYEELTRDPSWKPPQPGAVTPDQAKLVEASLMRYFVGPLAPSRAQSPAPRSSPLALGALPSLPVLPSPAVPRSALAAEPSALVRQAALALAALQAQKQWQPYH